MKIWIAEVEIWEWSNCRTQWVRYEFRVLETAILAAINKVKVAIKRQGFRHKKYRINSIACLGEID